MCESHRLSTEQVGPSHLFAHSFIEPTFNHCIYANVDIFIIWHFGKPAEHLLFRDAAILITFQDQFVETYVKQKQTKNINNSRSRLF